MTSLKNLIKSIALVSFRTSDVRNVPVIPTERRRSDEESQIVKSAKFKVESINNNNPTRHWFLITSA
jgi:hypothetical protein